MKTPQEWWDAFGRHKQHLEDIVRDYHPHYRLMHDMRITAPMAEEVSEGIRSAIKAETKADLVDCLQKAGRQRDEDVAISILNQTWFGIPESTDCWSIPAFGILCDLCSEAWVFCCEIEKKYLRGAKGRFMETEKTRGRPRTEYAVPHPAVLWDDFGQDDLPLDGGKERKRCRSDKK